MTHLLDTHVLIWAFNNPRLLSPTARRIIEEQQAAVSAASLWELLLKRDRADTPIKDPILWWQTYVVDARIHVLPIEWFHLVPLVNLPCLHADPFDRVLICQALKENLRLISKDSKIHQYKDLLTCVW